MFDYSWYSKFDHFNFLLIALQLVENFRGLRRNHQYRPKVERYNWEKSFDLSSFIIKFCDYRWNDCRVVGWGREENVQVKCDDKYSALKTFVDWIRNSEHKIDCQKKAKKLSWMKLLVFIISHRFSIDRGELGNLGSFVRCYLNNQFFWYIYEKLQNWTTWICSREKFNFWLISIVPHHFIIRLTSKKVDRIL